MRGTLIRPEGSHESGFIPATTLHDFLKYLPELYFYVWAFIEAINQIGIFFLQQTTHNLNIIYRI